MTNSSPGYQRIAMFDSGVGGLSVLRRMAAALPRTDFVYLGDTARLPYGNRSRDEIAVFVDEILSFLGGFKLDAVIMACNTSAALAKDVAGKKAVLQGFEVLNLIDPTALYISQHSFSAVGVLATNATANSGAFGRALKASNYQGQLIELGCPELVPLVESGLLGEPDTEDRLWSCLEKSLEQMAGADSLVLGCTHFPFVADRIRALISGPLKAIFPGPVAILDPAVILCRSLVGNNELDFAPDTVKGLSNFSPVNGSMQIFTTGSARAFDERARICLGQTLARAQQVDLSQPVFLPAQPVFNARY